jgi:hypothetical protein
MRGAGARDWPAHYQTTCSCSTYSIRMRMYMYVYVYVCVVCVCVCVYVCVCMYMYVLCVYVYVSDVYVGSTLTSRTPSVCEPCLYPRVVMTKRRGNINTTFLVGKTIDSHHVRRVCLLNGMIGGHVCVGDGDGEMGRERDGERERWRWR